MKTFGEALLMFLTSGQEPKLGDTVVWSNTGWRYGSIVASSIPMFFSPEWILVEDPTDLDEDHFPEVYELQFYLNPGREWKSFVIEYNTPTTGEVSYVENLDKLKLVKLKDESNNIVRFNFDVPKFELEVTPYSEEDGEGVKGTTVEIEIESPRFSGVGFLSKSHSGAYVSGDMLLPGHPFDYFFNEELSRPYLGLRKTYTVSGTNVVLDYKNGPTQVVVAGGDCTIGGVENMPDGATMNVLVLAAGGTVSLGFEGPALEFEKYNKVVVSLMNFGGTIVAAAAGYEKEEEEEGGGE